MSDAPTLAETFHVAPEATHIIKDARHIQLLKRLADDSLKPHEEQQLQRVADVLKYEAQGKNVTEIASLVGMKLANFMQFRRTQNYRIYRRHCAEARRAIATTEQEQGAQQRRQSMRRRFDLHDADALDYLSFAFRRQGHNKKGTRAGDFIDPDRAERATKLVAQSQGWLEPVPTSAKPKDLTPGVIQAQMQAMRAADKREMVVRVTTAGGETVEVGLREQQGEELS